MPKFNLHIPPPLRPRSSENTHTFQRLRSFYLTPSPTRAQFDVASLAPTPGASTNPSPTSAHFPVTAALQPRSTTADNSSERTLRAVCSMDSVNNDKYTYAKVTPRATAAKENGAGARKRFMGFRRPRRSRGTVIMLCVVALSLFLVVCLSLAFVGADAGEGYFKKALDVVAKNDPGIVLVGESIDVDIDEPSVEIRWSIIACGGGYVLPGSEGILGSSECGLPIEPLRVFVDGELTPAAKYDPTSIPYQRSTGRRGNIESLVRFTTTHVLDVHKARLYPFDRYRLTGSLRAARYPVTIAESEAPPPVEDALRISRVLTQGMTTNFDIETSDMESFIQAPASSDSSSSISSTSPSATSSSSTSTSQSTSSSFSATTSTQPSPQRRAAAESSSGGLSSANAPQTPFPSRDFDMHITRPPAAQMFVLLMFALGWLLVHISIGMVYLARRSCSRESAPNEDLVERNVRIEGHVATKLVGYTLLSVGVLGAVLGIRKSMPDAPGLDGILLDCIGFFPQVTITGICILILLFTLAANDIDALGMLHLSQPGDCHCVSNHAREGRQTETPRDHHTTDSEGSDSSAASNSPGHGVQYATRRQSLISAFPPPPGFRRSQSLSSPFSPASSSSPTSSASPTRPLCVSQSGIGGGGQQHNCTTSNDSSNADLGHWQFPSSTHSLPVSPTRFDVGRSRVMSPSPKIPRSPLVPLSPVSPVSPTGSTSPVMGSGRKKFAFALGSVFGGSPSPPGSPTTKLGFSISKKSPPTRKSSSASLGARAVDVGVDVELELRRSATRRESGVGHRRVRTASVVREGCGDEDAREVSRWSDHEDDD